jgi:hypothetical protein
LPRDPFDRLDSIGKFLRQIFIEHQPFGFAVAADVDADIGIAARGHLRMHALVPQGCMIALPVRDIFDNRGQGTIGGIHRYPHPGREAAAVGKRYPEILYFGCLPERRCVHVHLDFWFPCLDFQESS